MHSVVRGLQGTVNRVQALLLAALLVASLGIATLPVAVFAANEDLSTVADKTGEIGSAVAITDLQVTGDGNDSVNLTIYSEDGEFNLGDTDDITANGLGTNSLTISGLRGDVNASLTTLTYTPVDVGESVIEVNLGSNVTSNVIIDPNSGRAYTIVQEFLTWSQARVAAQQLEYGGVQGYLANITSEEEDAFIVANLTGNGWIGASDQEVEGDWKWMDGPEAGTSFWSGTGSGSPVLGPGDVPMYSNWNSGEPNNSSNEDCAEYIVGSGWNDLNCNGQTRRYVVEFGAAASAPDPVSTTFTVTATYATQNVGDCEALLALGYGNDHDTINLTTDIDCQGYEVEPLFGGNTFQGIFEGNGYAIRNVTINEPYSYSTGLLRGAYSAAVRDLTLDNFDVTGEESVGALAGWMENTTVSNVHVTNTAINAESGYAGGLVGQVYGYNNDTHIEKTSVSGGVITTDGSNVGGLIGQAYIERSGDLLVEQTFTDIDIASTRDSSGADTGGLIGEVMVEVWSGNEGAITLRDVYAWGDVIVPQGENIGGLVGRVGIETYDEEDVATITIARAYAKGVVTGRDEAGGLIGQFSEVDQYGDVSYELTNTFAAGKVTILENGAQYQGGLVGRNETLQSYVSSANNYWDAQRTRQAVCSTEDSGGEPLAGCIAVNVGGSQSNYFINNTSNPPFNTWDFDTIWVANQGNTPTFQPVTDYDTDGISDVIESNAPNGGDANNDGIPDSQQSNVASFVNPLTGNYVSVAVDQQCSLSDISTTAETSHNAQDAGYVYQDGFVNFTADCGEAGFTTPVAIYHYGASKDDRVLRKYNPEAESYFTINSASLADEIIGGHAVVVASYTITDGGELDVNGEEDGIIVDPVGLAAATSGDGESSDSGLASTGRNVQWLIGLALVTLVIANFYYRLTHRQPGTRHS